jgi:hypothetical protein
MPSSIQYRPKVCITRHKILCLGSSKMCMVIKHITKHILVGQLGNQGKELESNSISLIYWFSIFIDLNYLNKGHDTPPILNISGFWQWNVSVRSLLILNFEYFRILTMKCKCKESPYFEFCDNLYGVDYSLLLGGARFNSLEIWQGDVNFFSFSYSPFWELFNVQYWSHAQYTFHICSPNPS